MRIMKKINVMIAGIGGASLGTEIVKSLKMTDSYLVYGCDISETAYGLYDKNFDSTYIVSVDNYIENVVNLCIKTKTNLLIPGGEQSNFLLGKARQYLEQYNIKFIGNVSRVVELCSDKYKTFNELKKLNIPIPLTKKVNTIDDVRHVGLPCIIKPATGSGGSVSVFFCLTLEEAMIYAEYIRNSGHSPIAQEYIPDDEGEFTIGVLSLPGKLLAGSIALKRTLNAKLSIAYKGRGGVISSGYSQGYIDDFTDYCKQAERIAVSIGSEGPLNVQGRIRDGKLIPFEINPRFSASTYLRALANFNEVDIYIRYLMSGKTGPKLSLKKGFYLRSLTEQFVPKVKLS